MCSSGSFDGAPRPYDVDDPTGPLSVYGRTKLAGELAVHEAMPDAHVVRTAWVYTGGADPTSSASCGGWRQATITVDVVVDQIGSPTYVADLVSALLEIADRPTGAAAAARRQRRVRPAGSSRRARCSRAWAPIPTGCGRSATEDVPRPAARPPYSALSRPRCGRGRPDAAAAVAPTRWPRRLAD